MKHTAAVSDAWEPMHFERNRKYVGHRECSDAFVHVMLGPTESIDGAIVRAPRVAPD